jgi:hypothetical protein
MNLEPEKERLQLDLESLGNPMAGVLIQTAPDSNSNNTMLTEHLHSDHLPNDFLRKLFDEICGGGKPDDLQSVTTALETQNFNEEQISQELIPLDGLYVSQKTTSGINEIIVHKIETDVKIKAAAPNKVYYVTEKGVLKDNFDQLLYDYDNKHDWLETSLPEIFECQSVTQYGWSTSKMVLKIYLEKILLQYHERSAPIRVLWKTLEDKIAEFKTLALKQRIAFFDQAGAIDEKIEEIKKMQEVVDYIHKTWQQIKAHRKLYGVEGPEDLPKKLIVRKFTNKDSKQDFMIDLVDLNKEEPKTDNPFAKTAKSPQQPSPGIRLRIKIYLDEKLVWVGEPVDLKTEALLGTEINLILSKRPQILKFEIFERRVFWRMIDSVQMFVPYKNVLSEKLLTDSKKDIKFKKLKPIKEIERLKKLMSVNALDPASDAKADVKKDGQTGEQANANNSANNNILEGASQTKDDMEIIRKNRTSHIEEEFSGRLSMILRIIAFGSKRNEPLSTVKSIVSKCRKYDEHWVSSLPDVNDPRLRSNQVRTETEAMKKLKITDRMFKNWDFDSIRQNIIRFNKSSKIKLRVPLSHEEFLENPNLLSEIQKLMDEVTKQRQEQLTLDQIYEPTVDRDADNYLDKNIIKDQKEIYTKIKELNIRNKNLKQKSKLQLKDIISEFVFDIDRFSFIDIVSELFQQRRKFKPVIKKGKPISIVQSKHFAVVINVFRGVNMPTRTFQTSALNNRSIQLLQTNTMANNSYFQNSRYMMGGRMNNTMMHKVAPKYSSEGNNNLYLRINTNFRKNYQLWESEAVNGTDPSWNFHIEQEITIDPVHSNHYTQVQDLLGDITISVFDDVCTAENKVMSRKMVLLIEKRFLGSLKFKTIDILKNGGVSGTFRMIKPLMIFGYAHQSPMAKLPALINAHLPAKANMDINRDTNQFNDFYARHALVNDRPNYLIQDNQSQMHQNEIAETKSQRAAEGESDLFGEIINPFVHTLLDLRISIDPLIKFDADFWEPNQDSGLMEEIDVGVKSMIESDHNNLERVRNFLKLLKARRVEERCRLLFETSQGEAAVMNKLLDSDAGRSIIDSNFDIIDVHSYKKLAYFVSLIPNEEPERDRENLILNNQEILIARKARNVEKAFLLANYFIAISKTMKTQDVNSVWVVFGLNQIGRKTACVLRKNKDLFELWNSETAESLVFKQVRLSGFIEHQALWPLQHPKWQKD